MREYCDTINEYTLIFLNITIFTLFFRNIKFFMDFITLCGFKHYPNNFFYPNKEFPCSVFASGHTSSNFDRAKEKEEIRSC